MEKIILYRIYVEKLSKFLNGEETSEEEKKFIHCHQLADTELLFHKCYSKNHLKKNLKDTLNTFKEQQKWYLNFLNTYTQTNDLNMLDLEDFVKTIIYEVYHNKNNYILLLNILNLNDTLFLTHMGLTTCILAIILAMDASKAIIKLLISKLNPILFIINEKDITSSSKTIFNEAELIDLGILCLLQSISIVTTKYLKIKCIDNWNYSNPLDFLLYIQNTYKILEKKNLRKIASFLDLDSSSLLSFDKLSFDKNNKKITKVFILINQFYISSFRTPFSSGKGMSSTILKFKKNSKINNNPFLNYLISSISIPTIGSFITLNSGESGIIIDSKFPNLKALIFFSKNKIQIKNPVEIDLRKYPNIKIESIIPYNEISHTYEMVQEYLIKIL